LEGLARLDDMTYVPFSEQALSVIYQLAERPDTITGRILKSLVKTLFGGPPSVQEENEGIYFEMFIFRISCRWLKYPKIFLSTITAKKTRETTYFHDDSWVQVFLLESDQIFLILFPYFDESNFLNKA